MRRECWDRFPCHWLQRKALVSDFGMHHGTSVTHVPWRMSESLTRGGLENIPEFPAQTQHQFYISDKRSMLGSNTDLTQLTIPSLCTHAWVYMWMSWTHRKGLHACITYGSNTSDHFIYQYIKSHVMNDSLKCCAIEWHQYNINQYVFL